jgi:hypothetical protein
MIAPVAPARPAWQQRLIEAAERDAADASTPRAQLAAQREAQQTARKWLGIGLRRYGIPWDGEPLAFRPTGPQDRTCPEAYAVTIDGLTFLAHRDLQEHVELLIDLSCVDCGHTQRRSIPSEAQLGRWLQDPGDNCPRCKRA